MVASAADVASWTGVAIGAVSLVLAWMAFRKARSADRAVRTMGRRVRDRDLLDALNEMARHEAELQREWSAGNVSAAEASLRGWRDAAQEALDHLSPSGSQDRVEAWRVLGVTIRHTKAMSGVGGSIKFGAKTMEDALSAVDQCRRSCGPLREQLRHASLST